MKNIKKNQSEKLLACAMLEDNKRFLFLKRKEKNGIERIELPSIIILGKDSASQLVQTFREQTGIDGEISDIIFETEYNAGSRKRKNFIPCVVFRFLAKNKTAKISKEFSGFKWLALKDAKKQKIARISEWIKNLN